MSVGIWPFWSQQDKQRKLFKYDTCGNAKQLAFLQRALSAEGVDSFATIPTHGHGTIPFSGYRYVSLPLSNPEQRIHWNTDELRACFQNCKVAVLNNEYMAYPLRVLFPQLKIIQMCPVPIDSPLFKPAFDAADLVVTRSAHAADEVRFYTRTKVSVWPMFYDEALFNGRDIGAERKWDVLFLPRCSANNATRHVEFLEAVHDMPWHVAFTDVTRYLRNERPELNYTEPANYIDSLLNSKVVVSLYNSWNGEMGLYEAVRARCTPVVMRTETTLKLFGYDYPYMIGSIYQLRAVIEEALRAQRVKPVFNVCAGSYQHGVEQALDDIRSLLCR